MNGFVTVTMPRRLLDELTDDKLRDDLSIASLYVNPNLSQACLEAHRLLVEMEVVREAMDNRVPPHPVPPQYAVVHPHRDFDTLFRGVVCIITAGLAVAGVVYALS